MEGDRQIGGANHAIRLDEELKNIDKIAADKAFKMQKKRLDILMGDGYDAGVIEDNMRGFKLPEKLNKN